MFTILLHSFLSSDFFSHLFTHSYAKSSPTSLFGPSFHFLALLQCSSSNLAYLSLVIQPMCLNHLSLCTLTTDTMLGFGYNSLSSLFVCLSNCPLMLFPPKIFCSTCFFQSSNIYCFLFPTLNMPQ